MIPPPSAARSILLPPALVALALVVAPGCGSTGDPVPDSPGPLPQGASPVPDASAHRSRGEEREQGTSESPVGDLSDEEYFRTLAREYAEALQAEELRSAVREVQPGSVPDDGSFAQPPFNPYLEFGSDILAHDDDGDGRADRITKPYPFPLGTGQKLVKLITVYGDLAEVIQLAPQEAPPRPQPPGSVVLDLKRDVENWTDPRAGALEPASKIELGDLLYVTAAPEELREVEDLVNLFVARVRQIEIEAKIVEVTTFDDLDIGIRPVDATTPIFGLPADTFVRDISFDFANSVDASEALFRFSAVHDGLTFNAILEAVARFENVSIISRPKVAVREGGRAEIVNTTEIPFYSIGGIGVAGGYGASLTYRSVGIQLYVIPRVIGRDTIALNIDIEASQQSGTSVSFVGGLGESISNPVIATRVARTTVHLEPGQAVILGGLITQRTVDREKKIPVLGDFPILGHLFKSRFERREKTNVLFFIRPRILSGIDLNRPFE